METVQIMEWSEKPWGNGKMMIEQAKEELQILEAQHPNRFEYLKLELKSFIDLLQSQNSAMLLSNQSDNAMALSSSSAATQASSTSKKRRKGTSERGRSEPGGKIRESKQKILRANCYESSCSRRGRVEVVIERAQACLQKIQQFKTSF